MSFDFTVKEFILGGGTGTPTFQFYRRAFNIGGSGSSPEWKDIILKGVTALTLVNSKANGLNYLKLFGDTEQLAETYIDSVTLDGKCEQSGTPTPTVPVDIVCNNGTIKYSANMCNVNEQTALVGYYISTSGVVTADVYNWIYQDFIPVKPNTTYTLTMSSSVYYVSISEYSTADNSGFVVRKAGSTGSNTTLTITTGSTTNYIRFGTNLNRVAVTLDAVLAIDWMLNVGSTMAYQPYVEGGIYIDGTVETATDNLGNVATAQMLLSVGNYKDTQEVLSGSVTRNIGIKVLDGTENWTEVSGSSAPFALVVNDFVSLGLGNNVLIYSTHFQSASAMSTWSNYENLISYTSSTNVENRTFRVRYLSNTKTLAEFKQFLADQYAQGTPVICVYYKTDTTETVSGQQLNKAPVTVTGSLTGLVANVVSSSHTTPTPQQPLPINTNNGVLTYGVGNTYNTADGQGTFVTPSQTVTTRIYKAFGQLKAGKYNIKITGNFEFIFQYKDTNDLTPTNYGNIGTWTTEGVYEITDTSLYYGVAIRNAGGTGSIYPSNFNNIGSIGYSYLDVIPVGTVETVEITGKNLFDKTAITEGYYYNASGVYTQSAEAGSSDYIPVISGSDYTITTSLATGSIIGANRRINYFDQGKTWLSQDVSPQATDTNSVTVTIPNNAKYLRISMSYTGTYAIDYNTAQIEQGSTATTYEPYYNGGTATAELLLKVGDYQDVQSILDGEVTRNVGIYVFDGTESFIKGSAFYTANTSFLPSKAGSITPICTHFKGISSSASRVSDSLTMTVNGPTSGVFTGCVYFYADRSLYATGNDFKQWLADQYNSGTPVVVIYPLATATTETVTPQPLTIQAGTNNVTITQASMDNLELEVSYKAGVEVTVTEIENAQLDNSVEVTVNG